MWLYVYSLFSLLSIVVIGFVEPTTTVTESGEATLFVAIMDGTIPPGEQYIVTLTTADDTASSKTLQVH